MGQIQASMSDIHVLKREASVHGWVWQSEQKTYRSVLFLHIPWILGTGWPFIVIESQTCQSVSYRNSKARKSPHFSVLKTPSSALFPKPSILVVMYRKRGHIPVVVSGIIRRLHLKAHSFWLKIIMAMKGVNGTWPLTSDVCKICSTFLLTELLRLCRQHNVVSSPLDSSWCFSSQLSWY